MRRLLPSLFLLLAAAGPLGAQACIGLPLPDGGLWIAGTFGGDPLRYGAEATLNLAGPLALSADYLGAAEDQEGYTLGARAAYELPLAAASLCPTVGVRRTRVDVAGGEDFTRTLLPVGFGVGRTLPLSPSAALTVFALPEYAFVLENEGREDAGVFSSEFGALLGLGPLYLGASVRVGDDVSVREGVRFRLAFSL